MGLADVNEESINGGGQAIYWAIFGVFGCCSLIFGILTSFLPIGSRAHGYITTAIVMIACTAYYAMATNHGQIYIYGRNEDQSGAGREVFYARYIDWFFTTPLLLLDIILISGLPFGHTVWILFFDVAMIVLGLFGAIDDVKWKWGYYGASCLLWLLLSYGILVHGIRSARNLGKGPGFLYTALAGYLSIIWIGYPVVWGLCEGSNTISTDAEAAAYGGLDVFSKAVFGSLIMLSQPIMRRHREGLIKQGYLETHVLQEDTNYVLGGGAYSVATTNQRRMAPTGTTASTPMPMPTPAPTNGHAPTTTNGAAPVSHYEPVNAV